MSTQPKDMTLMSAQVPQSLANELRALAKSRDRSVSAELRLAMRAHLDAQVPVDRSPETERAA